MGLSDGERLNNVFGCALALSKMDRFTDYRYTSLNDFLDAVWPTFFQGESNGMYWILGGELDAEYQDEMSLLRMAFASALAEEPEDKYEETNLYYRKNYAPTPESFLDGEDGNVYKLMRLCDSFFYAANRYDDKLKEKFKPIRDLVSKIKGFCLDCFSKNETFAMAWMAGQVFDKVLGYGEKDFVTTWFRKQNIHHDVRLRFVSKNDLLAIFRGIQRDNSPSTQKKLEICFKFIGSKYYYDHQHEELFEMIKAHNAVNKKDPIKLDKIKALCKKSQEQHNKKEKEGLEKHQRYCHLTGVYEEKRFGKKIKGPFSRVEKKSQENRSY